MDENIVFKRYYHGSPDYRKALILRYEVLSLTVGIDSKGVDFVTSEHIDEENHILFGAFIGDAIVGTLNYQIQPDSLLLRQFAVTQQLRGQGIGRRLLEYSEYEVRNMGYVKIELHSRTGAYSFYSHSGYHDTGKNYVYPNLTLIGMYKEL